MANTVTLGRAYVMIGAKISNEFTAALASVNSAIAGVGQSMQRVGAPLIAAGAAITGTLHGIALAAINGQEAFADMSIKTGASAEFLSEFGYAASLADVEIGSVSDALVKMSLAQQKLREGTTATVDAFVALGITAKDLDGISVDERFTLIAEALSKVADQGKKVTIAREIFGRGAADILPAISGGAAGISAGRAEAVRIGASVTAAAAAKADEAGDMFARLSAAIQGLMNTIGNVLVDGIIQATTVLANLIARVREYISQHPELVTQAKEFGLSLLKVGAAITGVGVAMEGLSYLFTPGGILTMAAALVLYLSGALDGMTGSVKNVIMAFEIGGRSVGSWAELAGKAWAALLPVFSAIGGAIMSTLKSVWSYISASAMPVFNKLGNALGDSFWIVAKAITDTVLELLNMAADARFLIGGDKEAYLKTKDNLQALQQGSDTAENKRLAGKEKVDIIPTFVPPDLTGFKEKMAAAMSGVESIIGEPIASALDNVFGQGKSKAVTIGDIFKDLSRPFASAPGKTRDLDISGGSLAASKVAYESRGTFSAAEAGTLFDGPAVIAEAQLQEQKTTNGYLRDIADNRAQLVYEGE